MSRFWCRPVGMARERRQLPVGRGGRSWWCICAVRPGRDVRIRPEQYVGRTLAGCPGHRRSISSRMVAAERIDEAWRLIWGSPRIRDRLTMSLLEVKNLQAFEIEDRKILNGLTLTVEKGQVRCDHGAERLRQIHTVPTCSPASRATRCCERVESLLDGEDLLALAPDERAAKRRVPGVPVSAGDSWRCRR